VQQYFKRHCVSFHTTHNPDIKGAIFDRLHRTLEPRTYKYFTKNNTHRYLDVINKLLIIYNSSGYYFPATTIADFRTKAARPLEFEHDRWEVGLIEISYTNRYKRRSLHNTLHFDSEEITFPVKHHESVFDFLTNIPQSYEPSINDCFVLYFANK